MGRASLEQHRRGLLPDRVDHRLRHVEVASDDVAAFRDAVAAGEVAVATARFMHKQGARGYVPWLQADLAIDAVTAGADFGQFQSDVAGAADASVRASRRGRECSRV